MLYTGELNYVAPNKSKEFERQQKFKFNRFNTQQQHYKSNLTRSGLLRFPSAVRRGVSVNEDVDEKIFSGGNSQANALQQDQISMWERYAINTSIHGVKYTSAEELHWVERSIWIVLVLCAVFGVGYSSLLFADRFNNTPLATVVESIIFPVSDISYPSVTVCLNNRLSWKRIEEMENYFRETFDNDTADTFLKFMKVLDTFEYGKFSAFAELANKKLSYLDTVNITSLYKKVMHTCDEMFTGQCWWRNRYYECCKLFVEQKSEFGICYAFNSAVNDVGFILAEKDPSFPWRTSSSGQFSGLRFTINTSLASIRPDRVDRLGILVSIQDPYEWASSPVFIPSGYFASVVVKPSVSYVTPAIHRLPPVLRQCVFEKDPPENRTTLAGLKYLMPNCLSRCKLDFIGRYCNCTIGFLFPTRFKSKYSACSLDGFQCLIKYNQILNYYKPLIDSVYFDKNEEGLMCNCLPECDRVQYTRDVTSVQFADEKNDTTEVDVYFAFSSMIRYRTDVTFGFLDLMVAFGGLAGLFLGCSLLSGMEIIFYLVIGLYHGTYDVIIPFFTGLRQQSSSERQTPPGYTVKRINVSNKN